MSDKQPTRELEYGERWDTFCAIPDRVQSILDVGCGTGLGFQTYRRKGVRVVGVDNFASCIDEAAGRLDEALVFDVERQPWPEHFQGAFDVVAFCDVLEHLVDPWSVLRGVRPLLKPGGVVIASIPNLRQWRLIAKLALGRWTYQVGAGTVQRDHVRFFTRETVTDMFLEAGYRRPKYYWPRETFHLRGPERAVSALTRGALPDLLYGSYTVSAMPISEQA
ncbi:MAG: class I SAM-dependent methyltransferase [Chloroflexota bacterium]